jgi:hypothetical protein
MLSPLRILFTYSAILRIASAANFHCRYLPIVIRLILSRQSSSARVDSKSEMSLFFSNKVVRLLLSVSVSIWMAGGCLFGCATGAMGAEPAQETAVEDGSSCHAMPSHHSAKPTKRTTSNPRLLDRVAYFVPTRSGMMKDCPLGVNVTAATSKSSTYSPEPARGPVAALLSFEKQPLQLDYPHLVRFLHNRGSTHLRCCVFLI